MGHRQCTWEYLKNSQYIYTNVRCLRRQDRAVVARLFSLLLDEMLYSLNVPFNHSFGHVT